MSLIMTEGFEDGLTGLGKWALSGWNGVGATYGRNGNGGYNESGTNVGWNIPEEDQHDTLVVGYAIKPVAASNGGGSAAGFFSDAGATQHVRWYFNNGTHDLVLLYGPTNAGTIFQMVQNQWYYLEVKARLHDTLGSVEVRINNIVVYSANNVDTKNGGTKTVFDHLRLNTSVISPVRRNVWIDDMYLMNGAGSVNNDFIGDIAIETLFPNGNGDASDFVGSDGDSTDNYALVDEVAPGMTDWAGGSSVGAKDLYAVQNLSRTSGPVYGAVITAYVQNGDSGARGMGIILKKGATVTTPVETALTTTATLIRKVVDLDPEDSTVMTVADINGMQIGAEITS